MILQKEFINPLPIQNMDLGEGLRKVLQKLTGAAVIDEKTVEATVKELQRVLISNDVNVKLVFDFSNKVKERALKEKRIQGISAKEQIIKIIYEELSAIMGEEYSPEIKKQTILLMGLFGSGKTTTSAKLARFYQKKGLRPALICADTYRPAAFDQLKQLSEKINVPFYGNKDEKNAAKVVKEGLNNLKNYDVLIVDSAGRNALDPELVTELNEIKNVLNPETAFLVVSADIGQIAGKQAQAFSEIVPVNGVIISKLDGSAKGGGALSSVAQTNAKVAFVAFGEKIDDIRPFDAKKFVGQLLGFPDLESLLEKVKQIDVKINPEEMLEKGLTFDTFYEQMKATKQMGPLNEILKMVGMADVPKDVLKQGEERLKLFESLISSMTIEERKNPELVKKSQSRIERIAKGAGKTPEDVKTLIKEFDKMNKMFKGLKGNRGMMKQMQRMMKQGGMV